MRCWRGFGRASTWRCGRATRLEWILLEYGAALAGLVLVTVNPAYQAGELSYVLRQSRSAGLFHVALYRGNRMADIVAEVRDDLPHLREVVALEEFEAFSAEADPTLALPSVRPGTGCRSSTPRAPPASRKVCCCATAGWSATHG